MYASEGRQQAVVCPLLGGFDAVGGLVHSLADFWGTYFFAYQQDQQQPSLSACRSATCPKHYGCHFKTDPGGVLGGVLEPLKTDLGGVLTTMVDDI
jgi:hypothetical protein